MKMKKKTKGVVLLEAFLALMLMALTSYGLATVNSVQFSQMAAGQEADNARNYAEMEAEYLKTLGYEAVVTENKDSDDTSRKPRYPEGNQSSVDKASNARNMTKFLGDTLGAQWRSTATLGAKIENINGDSENKIQNVVVSVYKTSDGTSASPRATVTVPLSTQGSNKLVLNGNAPGKKMALKYEDEDTSVEMPEGKALYAYLGNKKIPLSGGKQSYELYYEDKLYYDAESYMAGNSKCYSIVRYLKIKTDEEEFILSTNPIQTLIYMENTYNGHTINYISSTSSVLMIDNVIYVYKKENPLPVFKSGKL